MISAFRRSLASLEGNNRGPMRGEGVPTIKRNTQNFGVVHDWNFDIIDKDIKV